MSKTSKIILAGVIALIVVTGVVWKFLAPKLLAGVQERLLSEVNTSINGRIEIEKMDVSVLGSAVLKNITLFDKSGNPIAAGEEISIRYNFSDLLGGSFGIDRVSSITIEKAKLNLEIDSKGKWSIQDVVKPQAERKSVFQGKIVFADVTVTVKTPNWQRIFSSISGNLDYSSPAAIAVDVKGEQGKTNLSAKGSWAPEGTTNLALAVDSMDLVDALSLLPTASGTPKVLSGSLKDVKVTLTQDKSGVQMSGDGGLSGLSINLQGQVLTEGTAKLKMQGKKINLREASALVDGNKLVIDGSIDFAPILPSLAMQVSSAGIDIASLAGGKASISGKASFLAELTGTLDKPTASGTFQLPEGKLDENAISAGQGSFVFAGETLTIQSAQAKAFGGEVAISGTLSPKSSTYNLKVSGQNVDGAVLTNKGISGRMGFDAMVSGAANPDSMIADGVFSIPTGKISDYEISNATGSFRKQGNRVDLTNVGLTLSGQRLAVAGSLVLNPGGSQPQLNLNISSSGLNANVFNPKSALKGTIAFQANVTGTPEKNQSRGNFQIGSGALGELAFSGASGGFAYGDGLLILSAGRAQCLGGTITLSGTVVPKTMEYRQQIAGQNIDAAQLTDRDVQGRADFTAVISGVGDWDKANGDGSFKMNSGSVKGIAFNGLTGNFAKRGRQTEFVNLKFNMLGGLATGTGATEGEYIRLIITPNAAANTVLSILTGRSLQPQDLRIRFRGPNG